MEGSKSFGTVLFAILSVTLLVLGYVGYRYWRANVDGALRNAEITDKVSPAICESRSGGFNSSTEITEHIAYGMIRADMVIHEGGAPKTVHFISNIKEGIHRWEDGSDIGGFVQTRVAFDPRVLDGPEADMYVLDSAHTRNCRPWWRPSRDVFNIPTNVRFYDITNEVADIVRI